MQDEFFKPYVDNERKCRCKACGSIVGYYTKDDEQPVELCDICPECGQVIDWS